MTDEMNSLFDENSIKKDENFEVEEDIDPSTIDMTSLFEPPKKEEEKASKKSEEKTVTAERPTEKLDNVPAPTKRNDGVYDNDIEDFITKAREIAKEEWSIEDIVSLITSVGEDGYAPASIYVSLERLKDIKDGMSIEDIGEDNREVVDDMLLKNCSVDFFSLNEEIANLVFTFDSAKDAYLHEFNAILNRYRIMQENQAIHPKEGSLPMLTISIVPNDLMGQCVVVAAFPLAFFRTLDDVGENASMHTMFYTENIQFSKIELTEEEQRDTVADVMRDMEIGESGQIFDE